MKTMILSLQEGMDVGKTTAAKYPSENAPYVNVSEEVLYMFSNRNGTYGAFTLALLLICIVIKAIIKFIIY